MVPFATRRSSRSLFSSADRTELAAQVHALQQRLEAALAQRDEALARSTRLEERLTEALEQQTATSEILGVMSSSPSDVQPVSDAVAGNAVTATRIALGTTSRRSSNRFALNTTPSTLTVNPVTLPPG